MPFVALRGNRVRAGEPLLLGYAERWGEVLGAGLRAGLAGCSMHTEGRGGELPAGTGWDSQRRDSDRMGQSSGLCFASADPSAVTSPQRLAAALLPAPLGTALQGLGCAAKQLWAHGNHAPPKEGGTMPSPAPEGAVGRPLRGLRAQPNPPSKLPIPSPVQQLQSPLLGEAIRPAGFLVPCTQRSTATRHPRACRRWKVNDARCNSTYSGSLLHNNRHLTQGSPDFRQRGGGEGREKSAGKGRSERRGRRRQSQMSISDRSAERPRAVTASDVKKRFSVVTPVVEHRRLTTCC